MHILEHSACPHCHGTRTLRLQDREFAICGVCAGRGYLQNYQKLTAAQILGMMWRQDPDAELQHVVNSGDAPTTATHFEQPKNIIKKS